MNSIGKQLALIVLALTLGLVLVLTPYLLNISRPISTTIPSPMVTPTITTQPIIHEVVTVSTSTVPIIRIETQNISRANYTTTKDFKTLLNFLLNAKTINNVIQPYYRALGATPLPLMMVTPTTPLAEYTALKVSTSPVYQRVSETNVQVVGVDEPDIVKTNGRIIVFASGSKIYVVDAKGREVLSVLDFSGEVRGVILRNNTLIALIYSYVVRPIIIDIATSFKTVIASGTANTSIIVVDLANGRNPKVLLNVVLTGDLVDARRVDGRVYVVVNQGIDFNIIGNNTLPLPIVNGEPLNPEKIHIVDKTASNYINIAIIDIDNLKFNVESFVMSGSSRIYMTPSRLYIISNEIPYNEILKRIVEKALQILPTNISNNIYKIYTADDIAEAYRVLIDTLSKLDSSYVKDVVNDINKDLSYLSVEIVKVYVFDIEKLSISLRGSIEAPGKLLDQFAIEEINNVIVLATTYSKSIPKLFIETIEAIPRILDISEVEIKICNTTGCYIKTLKIPKETKEAQNIMYIALQITTSDDTQNNVYLFNASTLQLLGKLEGLAKGERIYAARVVKNILFLVTFRQVDPLFAIDMSNPSNPRVLGFLKIPGFSEYLHPLPNDKLLGIGLENSDLKISLFDVSNPIDMKELSKIYIKNSNSEVLQNHRAITIDIEFKRVFIPLTIAWSRNSIAIIEIKNNTLALNNVVFHEGARRAIYIDQELFIVSPKSIKVYNYWTLEELYEIPLPQ
jgi:uncharacterized secreted protein with C-terminal beta-propeller domain